MSTATIDRLMTAKGPEAASQRLIEKRQRDSRLDFFRGLSLFTIFIGHVPGNPWFQFMPARFGFSDATDIFVFCSGMASALAFARVFDSHGAAIGTARIAHRCWEVYWAHIGCFMVVLALMIAADRLLGTGDQFLHSIGLHGFLEQQSGARLLGLMTLTYVPPYFDILPMYLIILTLIPPMMLLSRVHPLLPVAASVALWALASQHGLDLPRDPLVPEVWYFNPFSWQLVFFAGFSLKRGWLKAPKPSPILLAVAGVFLILCIPLSLRQAYENIPLLQEWRTYLDPTIDKTHEGFMRFAHFLSLAYVASWAAGEKGSHLNGTVARLVRYVGGQSLGCFMAGLALSFLAGVVLTVLGAGNPFVVAAVNLTGCALIVLTAHIAFWFKSHPWHRTVHMTAR